MSKPHTVLVILEAKEGKERELELALKAVKQPSQAEKACLEYRLHKTNLIGQYFLYENWENQEKHQEQFNKPYILTLGEKLSNLLAKPLYIISAEEI